MIEAHDEFEGVGAHPLNRRFDWIEGEHGEPPTYEEIQPVVARLATLGLIAATPPVLEGHDGSHYQWEQGVRAGAVPPVDFNVLAAATDFLWWKASQSTSYRDPTFPGVYGFAQRAKFEVFSPYHWLSPTTDPEKQADHFIRTVEAAGGIGPGVGIMGDFEEGGITEEWCYGFKMVVEPHWKRPLQNYSGLYVAGGTIWNSEKLRESKYGEKSPMHLAAYISEIDLIARMKARNAKPFDAWQYSSNGPVPGVVGRADMNTRINRRKYFAAAGRTTTPVPTPTGDDDVKIITNAEPRSINGAGPYPAGVIKWVLGETKRHIVGGLDGVPETESEWAKVWKSDPGEALLNSVLDNIPDYGSTSGAPAPGKPASYEATIRLDPIP